MKKSELSDDIIDIIFDVMFDKNEDGLKSSTVDLITLKIMNHLDEIEMTPPNVVNPMLEMEYESYFDYATDTGRTYENHVDYNKVYYINVWEVEDEKK
tara:strand:- start:273 stop:566 length:294 start_codon:yes stop_codon:yes gene_type:complete